MTPHRLIQIPGSIVDEIGFEIPDAPHDSVIWALKKSITEFCELSHYWQENIGPVRVAAGVSDYDVSAFGNAAIISINAVETMSSDGHEINLERSAASDIKYRFWQSNPFSIEVHPVDDLLGSDLSVIASIKPQIDSVEFEFSENVLADFREAVIAGAKARLYEIPRKPWFDPSLHQKNRAEFMNAASDALRSKARGYSRLPDKSVKQKARSFY